MIHLRSIPILLLNAAALTACSDIGMEREPPNPSTTGGLSRTNNPTQAANPTPPPQTPPTPRSATRMPLGTLFHLQQSGNVLIYDVRPSFTRALGSIPGSISWPKSSYDTQLPTRETEIQAATAAGKPVVFYCTDLACPDATIVATRLAKRGHPASVLQGGFDAWKVGGLPTQ
jgi:rhodanese-related sulfurtransferase